MDISGCTANRARAPRSKSICRERARRRKQVRSNNRFARTLRATETVLLVEDEEALRELTRSLLADQGYKVLEAARPERAIELRAALKAQFI